MREPERVNAPAKRFQFGLGALLVAMFYAAGLATLIVNLAGKDWQPQQIAVAYVVTIAFVVAFANVSGARGKIIAYVLLAPGIFVFAVIAASMARIGMKIHTSTTPVTTAAQTATPNTAPPPPAPGATAPVE